MIVTERFAHLEHRPFFRVGDTEFSTYPPGWYGTVFPAHAGVFLLTGQ
jgi:hypothetical protein